MTKYLCFVRTSPSTENDGWAQKCRILMGLKILHAHEEIHEFNNADLEFFNAIGIARSELMDSVVVHNLFRRLDTAECDEEIVVVVAQMDRIGIELKHTSFFLDYVFACKKIKFISIKEYGLKPHDVAQEISTYYSKRTFIGQNSSHVNPGKSISRQYSDEVYQEKVNEQCKSIQSIWDKNNK
jgi:hypothetical protein